MSDFTLVDPKGWEYDLQSVYSAYIGYFQIHSIAWYERSWGHLFSSFDEFLQFSWPVITVTDSFTGRPHIVTRLNSIGAFLKMIKTRFGEILPQAPNIQIVTPFETSSRHLRHISDYNAYRKLHSTLPAAALSAFKSRVRSGEPKAIKELWEKREKTFLALSFEWSERNEKSCLEWGYAAVRCGHLDAAGHWPPIPDSNYRKGHYVVSEYVDKVINKHTPTFPWHFAFGDSQLVPKAKLPEVVQAMVSCLASPDSETTLNNVVLVLHGANHTIPRLEEMKLKLPHNMLVVDVATYERNLFSSGLRPDMIDPRTNKPRQPGSSLSLESLQRSFSSVLDPSKSIPNVASHNAGNDAFMCLFSFQMLLDPERTQVPTIKNSRIGKPATPTTALVGNPMVNPMLNPMMAPMMVPPMVPMMAPSPMTPLGTPPFALDASAAGPMPVGFPMMVPMLPGQRPLSAGMMGEYDLSGQFNTMNVRSRSRSPGPTATLDVDKERKRRFSTIPSTAEVTEWGKKK